MIRQKNTQILGMSLERILTKIIKASLRASPSEVAFGHPRSHLIEDATRIGVKALALQLIDGPGEYRLNGAGLKLYMHPDRLSIGGDQEENYPDTVPKLKEILKHAHFSSQ